jgi:hypothetical protein
MAQRFPMHAWVWSIDHTVQLLDLNPPLVHEDDAGASSSGDEESEEAAAKAAALAAAEARRVRVTAAPLN